ncbi:MAG TPA: hypothetical protein HA306_03840 [Methanosarcina sp.]|nr:hypothetical protein [Methanosarcina sp.]
MQTADNGGDSYAFGDSCAFILFESVLLNQLNRENIGMQADLVTEISGSIMIE